MRVFINGSSVSRRLLSLTSSEAFEIASISAGQSLIPLVGNLQGVHHRPNLERLRSRHQRRALNGTLEADLAAQVSRHHNSTDLVLWDLSDERLGVYERDGRYLTRSSEVILSGLDEILVEEARFIPFGTAEHFDLWARGLDRWRRLLVRHRLSDRLVLMAPYWTGSTEEERRFPTRSQAKARERNEDIARYYNLAQDTFSNLHCIGSALAAPSRRAEGGIDSFRLDEQDMRLLAHEFHSLVYNAVAAFPPPQPIITRIHHREIAVTLRKTWAETVAVHAIRAGEVTARTAYQVGENFVLQLPRGGEYVLRGFHRAPGRTLSVNAEPITVQ